MGLQLYAGPQFATRFLSALQAHPQVTVRLATKPALVPGTSRSQRFNVLSCLFCNLAPYRVAQTMTPDIGVAESVLLPTEDWVEHEILKTPTGWIEVHTECLVSLLFSFHVTNAQAISDVLCVFVLHNADTFHRLGMPFAKRRHRQRMRHHSNCCCQRLHRPSPHRPN